MRFDEKHRVEMKTTKKGVAIWVDENLVLDASLFLSHGHLQIQKGMMTRSGYEYNITYTFDEPEPVHECNCDQCPVSKEGDKK